MEQIELPKNSWLDKALIQFHRGGFYSGYPEINLHFKGESPSTTTMLEILQVLASKRLPKLQLVWLHGNLSSSEGIYFLIRSLRDYGFFVAAEVPISQGIQLWYPLASWIQLWTPSPFVPFAPNELVYCPKALPAPDVEYPSDPSRAVFMRFNTANLSATQEEILDFMKSSKHTWSIM